MEIMKNAFLACFAQATVHMAAIASPIIQYAEGNTINNIHTVVGDSLTILQLNILDFETLRQALLSNADIICLMKSLEEDTVYAIYQELKNDYAYFYRIIPSDSASTLFVASKYVIESLEYTLYPTKEESSFFTFFNFFIKQGDVPLGRFYITDSASHQDYLLERMKLDFSTFEDKETPFFCSEKVSLCNGVKTVPLLMNEEIPFALQTTLDCVCFKSYMPKWGNVFCAGGKAEVSGNVDTRGNSSAEARISTSTRDDGGNTYSAGVSGGVYQDRDGEVSGRAEVNFTVRWGD